MTTLEIGPIAAALVAEDPAIADVVEARYAGFLSSRAAGWRVALGRRAGGLVPLVDVEARHDGPRVVLERHDFLATIDLERRTADVALGEVDAVAVDAALRVTWSVALLDADAVLLHAASLVRDGSGYVFPGRSGAGKTTIARLSPGAALLGDELAIVALAGGRPACHGTPFWGELARAGEHRSAPLRALYFPRQAPEHRARRLGTAEAVAALLANVVCFATDARLRARTFALAADLCEATPAFDLSFRRDPGFWDVIGG